MRILFWGTPDFGIPALRAIQAAGHTVVGVVTQPDRPAGRGRSVTASPVKRVALEHAVRILQPERPRGEDFLVRLHELEPEVSVVAAYGHILVDEVLEHPPLGSLNIHASLLPELRGAAPVNWAIIRGHRRSGVTVMRMVRELDAGPILLQRAIEIGPRMTAGELYGSLAELGAAAIVDVLAQIGEGEIAETEQDPERATYAPKLNREAARLDWESPAVEVGRWIRGCDPWPAAWSELWPAAGGGTDGQRGKPVQLFLPEMVEGSDGAARGARRRAAPGSVLEADPKRGLMVAAGRGALRIGEVKPAGRPRMLAAAWVRGRGVAPGDRFR